MSHDPSHPSGSGAVSGQHLATISHEGQFWDVFLELDGDPRYMGSCRGMLAFSPAGSRGEEGVVRTAAILIENSWEEVADKARSFESRQLESLLRSALP